MSITCRGEGCIRLTFGLQSVHRCRENRCTPGRKRPVVVSSDIYGARCHLNNMLVIGGPAWGSFPLTSICLFRVDWRKSPSCWCRWVQVHFITLRPLCGAMVLQSCSCCCSSAWLPYSSIMLSFTQLSAMYTSNFFVGRPNMVRVRRHHWFLHQWLVPAQIGQWVLHAFWTFWLRFHLPCGVIRVLGLLDFSSTSRGWAGVRLVAHFGLAWCARGRHISY